MTIPLHYIAIRLCGALGGSGSIVAEHIGSGQSRQFQALDEFVDWLRQELAEIQGEPES